MTVKTRKGLFETNSSSTHSVWIAEGNKSDLTIFPEVNEEGEVIVEFGEFGWERSCYASIEDKLSYAATYAVNASMEYIKDIDGENKYEVDWESDLIVSFINTITAYTGAEEVKFESDCGFHAYGYIDHQSLDEAATIFESQYTLEQFLFNPLSEFETDNDNY